MAGRILRRYTIGQTMSEDVYICWLGPSDVSGPAQSREPGQAEPV